MIVQLPFGGDAEVREMTGKEEDVLGNEKLVRSGVAVDRIMQACTVRLRENSQVSEKDIEKLASPDRLALMLAVRRATYGDIVDCDLRCPHKDCEGEFSVEVDLSKLPEKARKGDPPYEVTLKDGTKVTFGPMTGRNERAVMRAREDVGTAALFAQIEQVSGVHPNDIRRWLKEVSARVRVELRAAMEEFDCGIDVFCTAECEQCGKDVRFVVSQQTGFFFPKK
jgi:hypothetical protein